MIITKLKGGLGNQMFQYALGRQLAKYHQTTLKIDISMFRTYRLHTYSMSEFNIHEKIVSDEDIKKFIILKNTPYKRIIRKIFCTQQKTNSGYIKEKYFNFDPSILSMPDNIFLDGYWQSEKYFPDVHKELKKEFVVKTPIAGKNKEILKQIINSNSINLHIRRANYVSDPNTNKVHGTCSLNYYNKCIENIGKRLDNPNFFIFSDEPEWARNHLKIPYPTTIIDNNDADTDYEDLRLMSKCNHHIIANSTFSWWGAWLCDNPDKIIFAPKQWFNDKSKNTDDLIPKSWIRI